MHALLSSLLLLGSVASPSVTAGGWTQAPRMLLQVTDQTDTVLQDGRVLVSGGYLSLGGWPVAEAQLYDPATSSWSLASPMHEARAADTATMLPDGRVLVAGGFGVRLKPLAGAEIYDPVTGSWTLTSVLPATRFSHSASLLPDGRVLLVGGIVNGRISRSTAIYDPRTDHWTAGKPTHLLHAGLRAATLRNHDVLIAGAFGGGPEIFHPASNSWTAVGTTPLREAPIMERLPNGSVLLASGEGVNHRDLRTARLFDPRTRLWSATGSMRSPRNDAASAVLPDGRVLVAGGEQVSVHVLKSLEIYDPTSGTWTQGASMLIPRDGASATTLPDGKVMMCGGADFSGVLSSCEMYAP